MPSETPFASPFDVLRWKAMGGVWSDFVTLHPSLPSAQQATSQGLAASPPVSEQLFSRFRRGDEEALFEVAGLLHPRLAAYLRLIARSEELAEEAAQEAFLDAFRQRERIVGPFQLRAWVYTVARRSVFRELQRARTRTELAVEPQELERMASGQAGEQGAEHFRRQARSALRLALSVLSGVERDLLLLRYFGDLSIKELSDALSMPMGSVGVKLGRALTKARKALEAKGLGPEDLL